MLLVVVEEVGFVVVLDVDVEHALDVVDQALLDVPELDAC